MSVCHTDNTGDPDGEGAAGVKRCAYIGMRRGHTLCSRRTVVAMSSVEEGNVPHDDGQKGGF
jgi:hypothetical protein